MATRACTTGLRLAFTLFLAYAGLAAEKKPNPAELPESSYYDISYDAKMDEYVFTFGTDLSLRAVVDEEGDIIITQASINSKEAARRLRDPLRLLVMSGSPYCQLDASHAAAGLWINTKITFTLLAAILANLGHKVAESTGMDGLWKRYICQVPPYIRKPKTVALQHRRRCTGKPAAAPRRTVKSTKIVPEENAYEDDNSTNDSDSDVTASEASST